MPGPSVRPISHNKSIEAVMVKDPTPVQSTMPAPPSDNRAGEPAIYRYEPSGIGERSGHVPLWLKLVTFGLILWGVYYAMRYSY